MQNYETWYCVVYKVIIDNIHMVSMLYKLAQVLENLLQAFHIFATM